MKIEMDISWSGSAFQKQNIWIPSFLTIFLYFNSILLSNVSCDSISPKFNSSVNIKYITDEYTKNSNNNEKSTRKHHLGSFHMPLPVQASVKRMGKSDPSLAIEEYAKYKDTQKHFEEDKKLLGLLPKQYAINPSKKANFVRRVGNEVTYETDDILRNEALFGRHVINNDVYDSAVKRKQDENSFIKSSTLKDIFKMLSTNSDQASQRDDLFLIMFLKEFIRIFRSKRRRINSDGEKSYRYKLLETPNQQVQITESIVPDSINPSDSEFYTYVLDDVLDPDRKLHQLIKSFWFDPNFAENHIWKTTSQEYDKFQDDDSQLGAKDLLGQQEVRKNSKRLTDIMRHLPKYNKNDYNLPSSLSYQNMHQSLRRNKEESSQRFDHNKFHQLHQKYIGEQDEFLSNKKTNSDTYSTNFRVTQMDSLNDSEKKLSSSEITSVIEKIEELLKFPERSSENKFSYTIGVPETTSTTESNEAKGYLRSQIMHKAKYDNGNLDNIDTNVLKYLEMKYMKTIYDQIHKDKKIGRNYSQKEILTRLKKLLAKDREKKTKARNMSRTIDILKSRKTDKRNLNTKYLRQEEMYSTRAKDNRPMSFVHNLNDEYYREAMSNRVPKRRSENYFPAVIVTILTVGVALTVFSNVLTNSNSAFFRGARNFIPTFEEMSKFTQQFDTAITKFVSSNFLDRYESDKFSMSVIDNEVPYLNKSIFITRNQFPGIDLSVANMVKHRHGNADLANYSNSELQNKLLNISSVFDSGSKETVPAINKTQCLNQCSLEGNKLVPVTDNITGDRRGMTKTTSFPSGKSPLRHIDTPENNKSIGNFLPTIENSMNDINADRAVIENRKIYKNNTFVALPYSNYQKAINNSLGKHDVRPISNIGRIGGHINNQFKLKPSDEFKNILNLSILNDTIIQHAETGGKNPSKLTTPPTFLDHSSGIGGKYAQSISMNVYNGSTIVSVRNKRSSKPQTTITEALLTVARAIFAKGTTEMRNNNDNIENKKIGVKNSISSSKGNIFQSDIRPKRIITNYINLPRDEAIDGTHSKGEFDRSFRKLSADEHKRFSKINKHALNNLPNINNEQKKKIVNLSDNKNYLDDGSIVIIKPTQEQHPSDVNRRGVVRDNGTFGNGGNRRISGNDHTPNYAAINHYLRMFVTAAPSTNSLRAPENVKSVVTRPATFFVAENNPKYEIPTERTSTDKYHHLSDSNINDQHRDEISEEMQNYQEMYRLNDEISDEKSFVDNSDDLVQFIKKFKLYHLIHYLQQSQMPIVKPSSINENDDQINTNMESRAADALHNLVKQENNLSSNHFISIKPKEKNSSITSESFSSIDGYHISDYIQLENKLKENIFRQKSHQFPNIYDHYTPADTSSSPTLVGLPLTQKPILSAPISPAEYSLHKPPGLIRSPSLVTSTGSIPRLLQTLANKQREINRKGIPGLDRQFTVKSIDVAPKHDLLVTELQYKKNKKDNGNIKTEQHIKELRNKSIQEQDQYSKSFSSHLQENMLLLIQSILMKNITNADEENNETFTYDEEPTLPINYAIRRPQKHANREDDISRTQSDSILPINQKRVQTVYSSNIWSALNNTPQSNSSLDNNIEEEVFNNSSNTKLAPNTQLLLELVALQKMLHKFQNRRTTENQFKNYSNPLNVQEDLQNKIKNKLYDTQETLQEKGDNIINLKPDSSKVQSVETTEIDYSKFSPSEITFEDFEQFLYNLFESLENHEEWSTYSDFPPVQVHIPGPDLATKTYDNAPYENNRYNDILTNTGNTLQDTFVIQSKTNPKLNGSTSEKSRDVIKANSEEKQFAYDGNGNKTKNVPSEIKSLMTFLNPNKPEILYNINSVLDWMTGNTQSRANSQTTSNLDDMFDIEMVIPKSSNNSWVDSYDYVTNFEEPYKTYNSHSEETVQSKKNSSPAFELNDDGSSHDIKHLLSNQITKSSSSTVRTTEVNDDSEKQQQIFQDNNATLTPGSPLLVMMSPIQRLNIDENYSSIEPRFYDQNYDYFDEMENSGDETLEQFKPNPEISQIFAIDERSDKVNNTNIDIDPYKEYNKTFEKSDGNENASGSIDDNRDYSLRPSELITAYRLKYSDMLEKFNYQSTIKPSESDQKRRYTMPLQVDREKNWETINQPSWISSSMNNRTKYNTDVNLNTRSKQPETPHFQVIPYLNTVGLMNIDEHEQLNGQRPPKQRNNHSSISHKSSSKLSFQLPSNHLRSKPKRRKYLVPEDIRQSSNIDIIDKDMGNTHVDQVLSDSNDYEILEPVPWKINSSNELPPKTSLVTSFSEGDLNQTHIMVDVSFNYPVFSQLSNETLSKLNRLGVLPSELQESGTFSSKSKVKDISNRTNLNISPSNVEIFSFGYDNVNAKKNVDWISESNSSNDYDVYSYIIDTLFEPINVTNFSSLRNLTFIVKDNFYQDYSDSGQSLTNTFSNTLILICVILLSVSYSKY